MRVGKEKFAIFYQYVAASQKRCKDRTKVTINDKQEVAYVLSIGAKIDDLG